jgi:PAS domain S-box-containing protein
MRPDDTTIIVVEDEPDIRKTLCNILTEDTGHKVIGLGKGVDAMQLVRKSSFDIIIADIKLPDINGMEILELAREINPDAAVIIMTGYASVETAVDAVNQGAYAYFVKPFNPEEMKTTVINALKHQKLSQENKRLVTDLQQSNKRLLEANEELRDEIRERKQAEEELQVAEQNFRNSLDNSPLGIRIVTTEGELLYANKAILDIYGYSSTEEMKAVPAKRRYTPESYAEYKERRRMRESGKPAPSNYEVNIIRKDGKVRHLTALRKAVVWNGEVQFQTIYQDITERKRAEEALGESEERFAKAFRASPNLSSITTLEDGTFIDVNDSYTRVTGYSREEMIGHTVAEFSVWAKPEDRDKVMRTLEKEGRVSDVEMQCRKKSGEMHTVLFSSELIHIGGEQCVITVGVDITERKQAEELYRTLANSSPIGIYIVQDGKFQFVNPQFRKDTGFTEKELLNTDSLRLVHPKDRGKVKKNAVGMLKDNLSSPYEFRAVGKDGKIIWALETVTSIRYQGKRAVLGNFMDITERKQMEHELQEKNEQLDTQNEELLAQQQELLEKTREVEEANRLKSEFLANMSHDLRTPLNAIIGFSELMIDEAPGKVNEQQRQCLDDILSSGQHLLTLINEVLDLSKIESGKTELKLIDIDLAEVIDSLAKTMTPIITPRKQSLEVEVEKRLPPVSADEAKLKEVLLNLMDNSSKFTPEGGKLKVEAITKDGWCQICVIDNGIGIKKEDQERVFEPFAQLDNPVTMGKGGTGLGLALVKQIVQRHGGRIWIESEYEKGSRFTFTLPLATAGRPAKKEGDRQ